jgi:hypothetical protein
MPDDFVNTQRFPGTRRVAVDEPFSSSFWVSQSRERR